MIHVVTSRPTAPACVELAHQAGLRGVPLRLGGVAPFAAGDVVFGYGARRSLLAEAAAAVDGRDDVHVVNGAAYSKDEQYRRLQQAGLPVPRWVALRGRQLGPETLAELGGGAVIVKPDFGGFGRGVRLLPPSGALPAAARRRPHVLQEFIPCGGRCARVVVLGDRVATAIDRVAHDGVVAAYAGGRRGRLEPVELGADEEALCIRAARALDIEVAGVDLIRSDDRGPFILEVNHRFVPFHLRAMYGGVMAEIVGYLASKPPCPQRSLPRTCAPLRRPPAPRRWKLPRAVGSWA